ncbi:MAG TPA: hypothetical protein VJY12_04795 [Dysgonamonadaceae bacterium]|nr:hypothetical protein [Dysgonamonadaceae bacterium]
MTKKVTYKKIQDELNAYQDLVIEFRHCKELYEAIQPIIVRPLSHEPKGNSELNETERVVEKRLPIKTNMLQSLKEMEKRIYRIEGLIDYAGEQSLKTTLALRFLHGKTIEETAIAIDKDTSTVTRRTRSGIRNIVKNLNDALECTTHV